MKLRLLGCTVLGVVCASAAACGSSGSGGASSGGTSSTAAGTSTGSNGGATIGGAPGGQQTAGSVAAGTTMGGTAGAGGSGGSVMGEAGAAGDGDKRPNVVLIVADDMGFSDLGTYGGEIHTPNIDGLANEGLRFTNFYNASRCSPTRASLLTGQYAHKVNLAANGRSLGKNGVTIAEALGAAGYNTAMSGKWHLSVTNELPNMTDHMAWLNHQKDPGIPFAPLDTYPANRGFKHHWGIVWGVADYFDPFSLVDGTTPVASVPAGFYMTNGVTDKAVEYINEFSQEAKPFFIYVAFTAPHFPIQALPEDIAKYEGVYDAGWDKIRQDRWDRQLKAGLFSASNASLSASQGNDWANLTAKQKLFLSNAMQTHAAMVDRLDQGVGKIVESLKAQGKYDNTLIFVLSDNGASSELYLTSGFDRPSQTRAGQPIVYCGGQNPCAYDQPGAETTYAYIAQSWANAANTPFRYWKKDSFRGGNSTPFIVHWPAGLKTAPGSITETPGHVIDVLPTILDAAGASYPSTYEGHEITPLDGISLLPLLKKAAFQPHDRLFFEHEDGAALIEGDYKLVRLSGGAWELYNLTQDRTETKNLAASDSARATTMTATWQAWYDSVPH